jgi:hypothetical protein
MFPTPGITPETCTALAELIREIASATRSSADRESFDGPAEPDALPGEPGERDTLPDEPPEPDALHPTASSNATPTTVARTA